MMFGLPAACLAMYHAALPERRARSAGLFASMALTSFLTGVTEPIEFTFMFLAPLLYALHARADRRRDGDHARAATCISDSAFPPGLFDYVLNFGRAQRPLMLLPVGLAYFALYYGVFRFCHPCAST